VRQFAFPEVDTVAPDDLPEFLMRRDMRPPRIDGAKQVAIFAAAPERDGDRWLCVGFAVDFHDLATNLRFKTSTAARDGDSEDYIRRQFALLLQNTVLNLFDGAVEEASDE